MTETKIYSKEVPIFGEFLRRYVCFHEKENMHKIRLWGLFSWGCISKMKKERKIFTDYTKENESCWCNPNLVFIEQLLKPAYKAYLCDKDRDSAEKYDFDIYENGKLKTFILG